MLRINEYKFVSLSRYFRTVTLPPQNSAKAKKLGGESTARKSPISLFSFVEKLGFLILESP
ncbi:hypothetical protein COI93_02375 [Bacillus cereus]|uniref:Uncharacterized protein n=1 Tax=Bacillus cereus TaxID=1396 RepID=A0A2B0N219_BACCE|nr:hypothetical protein COI93_02375 [Bacillus cereus]